MEQILKTTRERWKQLYSYARDHIRSGMTDYAEVIKHTGLDAAFSLADRGETMEPEEFRQHYSDWWWSVNAVHSRVLLAEYVDRHRSRRFRKWPVMAALGVRLRTEPCSASLSSGFLPRCIHVRIQSDAQLFDRHRRAGRIGHYLVVGRHDLLT